MPLRPGSVQQRFELFQSVQFSPLVFSMDSGDTSLMRLDESRTSCFKFTICGTPNFWNMENPEAILSLTSLHLVSSLKVISELGTSLAIFGGRGSRPGRRQWSARGRQSHHDLDHMATRATFPRVHRGLSVLVLPAVRILRTPLPRPLARNKDEYHARNCTS